MRGRPGAARFTSGIWTLHDQVFRLADDVTFERVPDGAVVLVFGDGQLYSCNDTSAAFLAAVDGAKTLGEVAAVLADEFEAPLEVLVSDLGELAGQMQAEGIIVRTA